MSGSPSLANNRRHSLWIDCYTLVYDSHEDELESAITAVGDLRVIYYIAPVLVVQDLTASDLVLLHMAHPSVRFGQDEPGLSVIDNEDSFTSVEFTLKALGSHVAAGRFARAIMALIDENAFRELQAIFEKRPTVFSYGLVRV
jgi:hypothetical protein